MRYLGVLVWKELTQLSRSWRFGLLVGFVLLMIPPVAMQSVRWLHEETRRNQAILDQNLRQLEISAHVGQLREWGLFLTVPVDPLWVYCRGYWSRWGSLAHIDEKGRVRWVGRQWAHEQLAVLVESLDFSMLVLGPLALLALLMTYDAVSGERERGTWAFLLQTPASRVTVFVAKWLGRMIPVWLAAGGTWLAIALGVSLSLPIPDPTAWLLGSLGVLAFALLFLASIGLWGIAASVVTRTSAGSLACVSVLWLLAVEVWPPAAATVARLVQKPADPEVLNLEIALLEKQSEPRFWTTFFQQERSSYPPVGVISPRRTRSWKTVEQEVTNQTYELQQRAERQTFRYLEVLQWLLLPNPAEAWRSVLSHWVGTSWKDFRRFHEQAVRYGRRYKDWMEQLPEEVRAGYYVEETSKDPLMRSRQRLRPHLKGIPQVVGGSLPLRERLAEEAPAWGFWLVAHGALAVWALTRFLRARF
jgi:hypothetical protein